MQASTEAAIEGLESFVGFAHRTTKDKVKAKDNFAAHQPGHKALLWLIGSNADINFDLLLYPKFIKLVAHCSTAQEADDRLWDLMLAYQYLAQPGKGQYYTYT